MKTSFLYPATLALVLSAAAFAEEVRVQLKFEPGKVYLTEVEMKQETAISLGGQEMKSSMKMTATSSQTVAKAEKGVSVVQKMEKVLMDVNMAGIESSFDSENPEGLLAATMGPIMKAESTMNLGPDGQVISIEAEAVPGMEAIGLGEDGIKQAAREVADLMPNKVVAEGESWTATSKLPLEGMTAEPVVIQYTLTFDSLVEREGRSLAKILIEGKIEGGDENLQVVSKELTGEMLFDPEIGQPREMSKLIDLEIGLPDGVAMAEGAPGKMPMRTEMKSKLKEIK